ncbi:hypothetical protein Glove_103g205 [Diversispora epigaea]|uniref:Uncharacterized protein n=1 Tax=Diversispora epigaea TaxID=1348612 RepID=A0A397J375_9GLOM|nr:hypothetical protein Glove_103g205 [Diversispora epigaea]
MSSFNIATDKAFDIHPGLRILKSHMAICFSCWKLIKINDVNPKKSFHFIRHVDRLEPKNLIQDYQNYKNRSKLLATQA